LPPNSVKSFRGRGELLKRSDTAARVIFILALPALLMSAVIAAEFNSPALYADGFQKYGVSQTTGIAEAELQKAAAGLIGYFNSGEEYISVTVEKDGQPFTLFNQREVAHLKDVKNLVRMDYGLLIGMAIYVGVYAGIMRRRKQLKRLARAAIIGGGIAIGMIVAMGVGSTAQGFGQAFTQFHFLAFTNELWMLDPSTDYLLMLFPEGFWYDAAVLFGGIVAGAAGAVMGASAFYLRRTKRVQSQPIP